MIDVGTCSEIDIGRIFVLLVTLVVDCLCVQVLKEKITACGKRFVTVLLSEVFPDKLKLFQQIDA